MNGEAIYQILSAVVPLYFAMLLGYGSVTRWGLLTPTQCAGINKFAANIALPMMGFKVIANGDFYSMDLRFIGADTLQKATLLVGLFVWSYFSRSGKLDWVIVIFSTTTLANTLVIGVPLVEAMYPGPSSVLLVQIILLQIVIWTNVLLVMFEYKAARTLLKTQFLGDVPAIKSIRVDPDVVSLGEPEQLEVDTEVGEDGQVHIVVRRSFSRSMCSFSGRSLRWGSAFAAPNRRLSALSGVEIFSHQSSSRRSSVYPGDLYGTSKFGSMKSLGGGWPAYDDPFYPNHSRLLSNETTHGGSKRNKARSDPGIHMHNWSNFDEELESQAVHAISVSPASKVQEQVPHSRGTSRRRDEGIEVEVDDDDEGGDRDCNSNKPPALLMAKLITEMVWRKFRQNPNTYACVLGLAWSLLSVKLNFRMPLMMKGCVSIISNMGLGTVMYGLGLFVGLQPKIISCGKTELALTMAAKFVLGPFLVAVAGLALGLRGTILNIAILQAALPLANVPFVFAQEYDVYPNLISSGVILGMLIAIPIALVYNVILEKL